MVALTVGAIATVATVVATGGAAIPAAAAGVAGVGQAAGFTAASISTAAAAASAGTAATIGTTVGTAVAGGGVLGSLTAVSALVSGGSATVSSVMTTGCVGGLTGSLGGGAWAAAVGGVATGPIGWVVLGADECEVDGHYTFDCWKPVLHDESLHKSNGKLLWELATDPRIARISIIPDQSCTMGLPQIALHNVWNETFLVKLFNLPSGQLVGHADKVH